MKKDDPRFVIGNVFMIGVETVTKEMFKNQIVTSSIISAQELLKLRMDLVIYILLEPLKRTPWDEIQKEYEKKVAFIESLTTKV